MDENNSIGSSIDSWMEKERLLAEAVKIIDGYIVVNVAYEYNFPLSECDTYEKILHSVWHLSEKTWMNQKITRKFIQVACTHHRLNYR